MSSRLRNNYRSSSRNVPRSSILQKMIMSTFANNAYNGALYNYSNISTLDQSSAGTTPVTAVTNPIGLCLDGSKGLTLGAELWPSPTFDSSVGITLDTGMTISGGKLVWNNAVASGSTRAAGFTVGNTYKITYTIESISVANLRLLSVPNTGIIRSTPGTYTEYLVAGSTEIGLQAYGPGAIAVIDNVSIRLLDGSHLTQTTAGSKPTYNKRVNLALQSNELSTSPWATTGTGTVLKNAVGLSGAVNEAWTITDADAAVAYNNHQDIVCIAANYTKQVAVKKTIGAQATYPIFWAVSTGGSARIAPITIDTTNGIATIFTAYTAFTVIPGITASCVTHPSNSGFWLVKLSFLATAETYRFNLNAAATANATQSTGIIDVTLQGSAVVQNFQVNYGLTAERYQTITTATSFDEVGFPPYINFDGIDDSLTSATGGGGSTGFYLCTTIKLTGGAGTARELYSDSGTNTGIHLEIDAANKLSMSAGNGITFTTLTSTAALNIGTTYLLEAYITGGVMYLQINGATADSIAAPTITVGTASYTIGKDNLLASDYLIGNIYSLIYWKNTAGTPAERAVAQAYCRMRAGM